MTRDDFVAWMRDEHEKVQDLANCLRGKVAFAPQANLAAWINEVQDRFDHFRAHLTKKMALEEQNGHLTAVTERRPALAPEVERLCHEHAEVMRIMDGIHRTVHELAPDDRLLIRDSCARIQNLLSYVEHHEELENNLVTFAFTQDIGTRD